MYESEKVSYRRMAVIQDKIQSLTDTKETLSREYEQLTEQGEITEHTRDMSIAYLRKVQSLSPRLWESLAFEYPDTVAPLQG